MQTTKTNPPPVVQSPALDDLRRDLAILLSHELRTPLTLVIGGIALLAEELQNCPSAEAYLNIVHQGITRLQRLFDEVSLYTELASPHGDFQVQFEATFLDMRAIVTAAVQEIHKEYADRAIQIVFDLPRASVLVLAVNALMQRAVYEVLRNAVMYSDLGHKVFITLLQQNGVCLRIRDEGWGITSEHQHLIWEPLTQTNRHRQEQQGVGMGLSLVRQIVRLHHGDVDLVSQLGIGTTVTFHLPTIPLRSSTARNGKHHTNGSGH